MPSAIRVDRAKLDRWLRKNRGYSLDQFDATFAPIWSSVSPMDVLYAIVFLESAFDPTAQAKNSDGVVVARGLFQTKPSLWPSSTSTSLRAHAPALQALVDKGGMTTDFLQVYGNHFLPGHLGPLMRNHPGCRFYECVPTQMNKKSVYKTAYLQYVSFLIVDDVLVPVYDVDAFYQALSVRGAPAGFSIADSVSAVWALATVKDGLKTVPDHKEIYWSAKGVPAMLKDHSSMLDMTSAKQGKWGPYSTPEAYSLVANLPAYLPRAMKTVTWTPGQPMAADFSISGEVGFFSALTEELSDFGLRHGANALVPDRVLQRSGSGSFVTAAAAPSILLSAFGGVPARDDLVDEDFAFSVVRSSDAREEAMWVRDAAVDAMNNLGSAYSADDVTYKLTPLMPLQTSGRLELGFALRSYLIDRAALPSSMLSGGAQRLLSHLLSAHVIPAAATLTLSPSFVFELTRYCVSVTVNEAFKQKLAHQVLVLQSAGPALTNSGRLLMHGSYIFPFSLPMTPIRPLTATPAIRQYHDRRVAAMAETGAFREVSNIVREWAEGSEYSGVPIDREIKSRMMATLASMTDLAGKTVNTNPTTGEVTVVPRESLWDVPTLQRFRAEHSEADLTSYIDQLTHFFTYN